MPRRYSYIIQQRSKDNNHDQEPPAPRWLIAFAAAVALCLAMAAAYIGWLAYQTRNTTPFERDTQQYEGWMFAEYNQLKDVRECEDKDGGWAALGIETSEEFVARCREWFKLK